MTRFQRVDEYARNVDKKRLIRVFSVCQEKMTSSLSQRQQGEAVMKTSGEPESGQELDVVFRGFVGPGAEFAPSP